MIRERSRKKRTQRLSTRLAIGFGIAFLVMLIVLEMFGIYGFQPLDFPGRIALRRDEALKNLSLVADLKKERLKRWIEERRHDTRMQAAHRVLGADVERLHQECVTSSAAGTTAGWSVDCLKTSRPVARIAQYLETIKRVYGIYRAIHVVDSSDATILVSTNVDKIGSRFGDGATLTGALLSHETYLGRAHLDEASGRPVLTVSHVIHDNPEKKSTGTIGSAPSVLVMILDSDDLLTPMLHTGDGLGEHGEALLVNSDVEILNTLKHPIPGQESPKPLRYKITAAPALLAARGHEGIIESLDYRGEPVLAAYRHIRITTDRGWGLVVKQDSAELFAPIGRDLRATAVLTLIGALLFMGLAFVLARRLTQPLRFLTEAAERVADGDFDARAPVISNDEVGLVADEFNRMVSRIGGWHAMLEEEIKSRTAELHDSRRLLSLTLRSIGDGVITTDLNAKITSMNPVAEKLTGWTESSAQGQPLVDVFMIENALTGKPAFNPVDAALEHGRVVGLANHTLLKSRHGTSYHIADSAAPITDDEGSVLGVVLVFRDVTDEYLAREKLESSEEKYRALFDNAGDAIFLLRKDGRVISTNVRARELLGKTRPELEGSNWVDFVHPIDQAKLSGWLAQIIKDGRAELSVRCLAAEERIADLDVTASLVGPESDVIQAVARDVTETKQMQSRLLQTQKMEAVGTLAGGLAHDMNNVLAAIMGLASVLKMELSPDDPHLGDVEAIADAARRGSGLTRSLMTFVRSERSRKETTSINTLVEEVVDLLGRTIPKNIRIQTALTRETTAVECHRAEVGQALMNVTLNAIAAIGEAGTITIATRVRELSDEESAVHPELVSLQIVDVTISDDGAGMDEATRARALEPFFTTKPAGEGSGLGLSMAYAIASNMGGTLTLTSEIGMGTAVTFLLPRAEQDGVDVEPNVAKLGKSTDALTILIVDDEAGIRESTSRLLKHLGYSVLLASNGDEALTLCADRAGEIDGVILDKVMPGMDGLQCLRLLRERHPLLPVAVCSGTAATDDVAPFLDNPHTGFIAKPFEVSQLHNTLLQILGPPDPDEPRES